MPDISGKQTGKYKIVFYGELQKDQDLYSVKSRLSSILKIPLTLVEKIFTGKPVLLRTGLSLEEAQSFKTGIEKTGILCRLLRESEKAEPPQSASSPGTQGTPAPVSEPFPYRPPKAGNDPGAQSGKIISMVIGIFLVILVLFNLISRTRDDYSKPKTAATSETSPAASKTASSSGLLSRMQTDFTDPKRNYSVYLPRGFRVTDKSAGKRSKVVFNYPGGENVTILATPMANRNSWDPQSSMDQKVRAIREGRASQFSRFEITHYGLVFIGGTDGYEIVLKNGSTIAHAYALVSLDNTALSISIVTSGKNSRQNHDLLTSTISRTLRAY